MKKFLIATAALTLMCGASFAQSTTQSDTKTKPGMTNETMEKGSMDKVKNGTTTGMSKEGTSGARNDRMTPERAAPDAGEAAPAGR